MLNMGNGLFTRSDVSIPWSECESCGVGTRSHLLEPALYNEYITQQIIDQSDEYANKQWEEVEDVIKLELAEHPIVMCHKCWNKKRRGFDKLITEKYPNWIADPSTHIITIQRILRTYQYYKFKTHIKEMKILLSIMKGTHTREEE